MKMKSLAPLGAAGFAICVGTTFAASPIYFLNHENLPASGSISNWDGASAIGAAQPVVDIVNGEKWSQNTYVGAWNGYRVAAPSSAITVNGATIIAAAIRGAAAESTPWTSIVDVMYDKLTLGIKNDTGQIVVRRNGSVDSSVGTVNIGEAVILSMTVQPDGAYTVWANDVEMLSGGANGTMTEWDPNRIVFRDEPDWAASGVPTGDWGAWFNAMVTLGVVPGPFDWGDWWALPPATRDTYWGYNGPVEGFKKFINVGRNEPDGWTAFSGNIGDVKIFGEALSDSERLGLVSDMTIAMNMIPEPSILGLLALAPALAFRRRRA